MPEIKISTVESTRVLTISNEPKRNALSVDMSFELLRLFDEAEADSSIRVVVVTGAGDEAFCSGHDLQDVASGAHDASGLGEAPTLRPLKLRKPVIAAVNGHCHAAGMILAISCDLRVASESATFGSPGVRLGRLPEGGQIARLPKLMTRSAALELMLTGEPMTATQAMAAGFVSRLVPRGMSVAAALELARSIAKGSPGIVNAVKVGVLLAEAQDAAEAERFEQEQARRLEKLHDAKEGVDAFLQKRKPVFQDLAVSASDPR